MKELNKYLNTIIKGDCIEVLKTIPDNSIDLIFADPPYNLQLNQELYRPDQSKVAAVNDEWDKFDSFKDYDNFCENWLNEARRVLKKTGAIWVIGSYHNIFRIGKIIQDTGFWILNDILWIKTNPMPNFKGTRFNNAHETLIWALKQKDANYTFHYKSMKTFNDDLQLRSDWYIPVCNGKNRLKDKDGNKIHSTQKPESLLYRIIVSTTNPGDIILDPFMGSGTTGCVAKKLGRNYIGIEKDENYIYAANQRINKTEIIFHDSLLYPLEIKKPKVPFGNLVEDGLIKPGEYIYSKNKKFKAQVIANGTIIYEKIAGSIHKISSELVKKNSNNGWTFWYVERDNQLISIDKLRDEFIGKYYNTGGK